MNISTIVTSVLSPIFDAAFKWKSQSDKMEISRKEFELLKQETEAGIRLKLLEEMRKPQSEFRDFMLKYEGDAELQSPFMRAFRSSVRPVITYWSLIIITLIMFGHVSGDELSKNLGAIPKELWQIFLAIFGFWFGGRALMQVADTWKTGDVKKQETEAAARRSEAEIKLQQARVELQKEKEKKRKTKPEYDEFTDSGDFWDEDDWQ